MEVFMWACLSENDLDFFNNVNFKQDLTNKGLYLCYARDCDSQNF